MFLPQHTCDFVSHVFNKLFELLHLNFEFVVRNISSDQNEAKTCVPTFALIKDRKFAHLPVLIAAHVTSASVVVFLLDSSLFQLIGLKI
jgi:hypothetical protein